MSYSTVIVVRSDDTDSNFHVRNSRYLDYADHARWEAMVRAGLSTEALAAARLGPVILDASVTFRRELRLGDSVRIDVRHDYPTPKIAKVHHLLTRGSDGVVAAEVEVTSSLLDLDRRVLVDDAVDRWRGFLTDLAFVDLASE